MGIKAGVDQTAGESLLAEAGRHLVKKGAELILLGCTEVPLAFNPQTVDVPSLDSLRVLAERAVQMYMELSGKAIK